METRQNRYPGVQPFRANQRHLFFGRDEDIENLCDFILLEKLVVLFGKSGYGKSSLLSAGVLPMLGDENQPANFRFETVEVRFGSYVEGSSFSPLETVRRVAGTGIDLLAFQKLTGLTLWQLFKQRQVTPATQFLLVFDQFEELFTYPAEQQREFRWQLAELLFSGIPQSVRETLDTLPEAERLRLVQPMNVKAVFSIRSDRMSHLDSMKDALPTILHKRYELRPLTPAQARDAIVKPAGLDSGFGISDFGEAPVPKSQIRNSPLLLSNTPLKPSTPCSPPFP
jgi:hypothetical protein